MSEINPRWIAFDDELPPLQDNGRGDSLRRKVLVTNNVNARDAFGDPSHVWIGNPCQNAIDGWHIWGGGKFLTHWMDPFAPIDAALIKAGRKAAPEPVRHVTIAGGAR